MPVSESATRTEPDGTVLVFRNPNGAPVAVPTEVAEAAERPLRAHKMHMSGWTWTEIAKEEGYLNAGTAAYDVKSYLSEGVALLKDFQRGERLALEVSRLDALQSAVWGRAMEGNLPAVDAARMIIMSRSKLLKLDEMVAEEGTAGPRTVIIPGDSEGYTEALTKLVEQEDTNG